MKHYGDITKLSGYDLPIVDVICGGSPCQDLSQAGNRAGLQGERSSLFLDQIRIVKEMREHDRHTGRSDEFLRPRYMVWENVPGAFSSNKGEDFKIVLTEIVKIAEPNAPDVPKSESGGDGTNADASMAWESLESPFPWLGEFTMHSTGVSRNGEKESVFWLTSTDPRRQKYCLTLNLSEFPRTDIPSRLSDILEQKTDKRYYLSARACEGILNRAIRRGKELPEILKTALENQIRRFSDEQDS